MTISWLLTGTYFLKALHIISLLSMPRKTLLDVNFQIKELSYFEASMHVNGGVHANFPLE